MEALSKFVQDVPEPVHVALDEFQEITEIEDSLRVEGRLRHYIQKMKCGFVFVGSRRRILLEMFNNRKRPFFQSTINYELGTLPREMGARICDLLKQHPYYTQKFCFLLFDRADKAATVDQISDTYRLLLESERALFEAILRKLTSTQTAVLTAIAKEPGKKLFAADYMARHGLKSTGGIQRSLSVLSAEDLVAQHPAEGTWALVDPMLRQWLVEKAS
jgi:hypothetical protein